MVEFSTYQPQFLDPLVEYWNREFRSMRNFVPVDREQWLERIVENEWEDYRFESEGFHLALDGDEILGFVHAGSLPANPDQKSDARLGYIACLHVMPQIVHIFSPTFLDCLPCAPAGMCAACSRNL